MGNQITDFYNGEKNKLNNEQKEKVIIIINNYIF